VDWWWAVSIGSDENACGAVCFSVSNATGDFLVQREERKKRRIWDFADIICRHVVSQVFDEVRLYSLHPKTAGIGRGVRAEGLHWGLAGLET
jgi:hypothetical protein